MTILKPLALALCLTVLSLAPQAFACQLAGPNTHVGTVVAIDTAQKTFTMKDAETGTALTFVATPEMLKGLAVKDQVTIVFAPEGEKLRATSIKKG